MQRNLPDMIWLTVHGGCLRHHGCLLCTVDTLPYLKAEGISFKFNWTYLLMVILQQNLMTNHVVFSKTSGHRWIHRPTTHLSVCPNVGHKQRPRILWAVTNHGLYQITTIIWVTICRQC